MRLDELKNEFPETPEFIHKMVLETVAAQVGDKKNTVRFSGRKKGKKRLLPEFMRFIWKSKAATG